MPTTIAHSLAGVLISQPKIFRLSNSTYKTIAVSIILANLADVDFLPGLLTGNPNKFHHAFTHSLGAAFVVSLLFAGYFLYRQGRFLLPFIFAALGYSSHILLDFFSVDTSPPYGIPMFWPFSSEYFVSSIDIFSDVRRSFSTATFFQSLLVSHNVWTVLREILILGPLVLIFQVYRFFKAKSSKYSARYYQG